MGSSYGFSLPDAPSPSDSSGTTIISRGILNASFDANANSGAGVALDQADRFTNEGTITLVQAPNNYGLRIAAISGGMGVTNNGQIILDGGAGISGSITSVVNAGTIRQLSGGAVATGVFARDLTNSGTIDTGGVAVWTGDYIPSTIRNSGVIVSNGAQAIRGGSSTTTILNEASGAISGGFGFDAIALLEGGALSNAGIINGNVNLAYESSGGIGYAAGAYVDRGGTLNGNLSFGSGNDIFVATSDTIGVLGTIDAGAGIDTFARSYDVSRSVDLLVEEAHCGQERRYVGLRPTAGGIECACRGGRGWVAWLFIPRSLLYCKVSRMGQREYALMLAFTCLASSDPGPLSLGHVIARYPLPDGLLAGSALTHHEP